MAKNKLEVTPITITQKEHSLIIRCSDPRLDGKFQKWMKNNIPLSGRPALIYIPGAIYDFVNAIPAVRKNWRGHISALIVQKKITHVVLCSHDDCLIYNSNFEFGSLAEEKEKQISDVIAIENILTKNHTNIRRVDKVHGNLMNGQKETFEFEKIS